MNSPIGLVAGPADRTITRSESAIASSRSWVMNITDFRVSRPELEQLVFHELPRLHIERRKRLVHEHDLGIEDQHLRQGDPFAHAAGELVRITRLKPAQSHAAEPFVGAAPRLVLGHTGELESGENVVARIAPWHQRFGLEHVAGAAIDAGKRRAQHAHVARRGLQQPGRDIEQRRLAATGRAHDRDEFSGGDGERRVLDRGIALAALFARCKRARDMVERQRRAFAPSQQGSSRRDV